MFKRGRIHALICVLFLVGVLTAAFYATGTVTVAGFTPGAFNVNLQNGAAEYSIPIKTPVGIKGIEPNLSIGYNSSGGNGLLGIGWSLSGIPVISRRPTIGMRDGIIDPVDYDENDRFSLNGNTLICISGTYGQNGAEYRTERDEFAKIVSYGTAGTGPAYFRVWTKEGKVLEFGNTADSRIEAVGRSDVTVWAVNMVSDRCGNPMNFFYTEDASTGEYRIDQIDYAYTSGQPRCSIMFEYEDRDDQIISYAPSSFLRLTKRLKSLQTYVGTQMMLDYELSYEYGGAANRSRLVSMTECSGSGDCLPPTTFTWANNEMDLDATEWCSGSLKKGNHTGDFNGDGKADILYRDDIEDARGRYVRTESTVLLSTGTGFDRLLWATDTLGEDHIDKEDFFTGDFNGDGLSDMMIVIDKNAMVFISNGSGFVQYQQWSTDGKMKSNSSTASPTKTGDFNGDGMTDVVSVNRNTYKTYIWLSNGSGFDFSSTWFQGSNPATYSSHNQVGDFNGDGMTDIVSSVGHYTYVWLSEGNGFEFHQDWGSIPTTDNVYKVADYNGDGKTDLCYHNSLNNVSDLYLSTGSSFLLNEIENNPHGDSFFGDFNGDGVIDQIYYSYFPGGMFGSVGYHCEIYVWNGHDYSSYQIDIGGNQYFDHINEATEPSDFDGDGKYDFGFLYNGGIHVATAHNPTKDDVITSIVDGLGKEIDISYKPLTDSTIYQKLSDAPYPTIRDYQGASYAVSQFSIANGLGGMNSYSYDYTGARFDTARRERLCFESVELTDNQTGIRTSNHYLQLFPFSGRVKSVKKYYTGSGSIISSSYNNYDVQCYDEGTLTDVKSEDQLSEWFIYESIIGNPSTTYFTYLNQSLNDEYLLTGSDIPVVTALEEFSYQEYGDLVQRIKTLSNKTETHEEKVTYEYYAHDYSNWILGLIKKSISTNDNQLTRTMSYEYDFAHRLPTKEIVEPTGNQSVKLTRDYVYTDPYYNLTSITETGYNGSANGSRTTSFAWAYGPNQFSMTKVNPELHTETFDYDWQTGKAITYSNPNGIITDWYYDDFGRLEEEQRPDGSHTINTYTQGGPVTDAVYSLTITESGKAPVTISFDELNREIYRQTLAQDGQTISKYVVYNEIGKVDTQSRFHFSNGNPQITTFDYDILGRVIQQNSYNTGTTTFNYNADGNNSVLATNAKSQKTKQVMNVMGLLAQVVDDRDKITTYTYTPFGDLYQLRDSSNNTTTLSYDIRGRRIGISDPDMGSWSYTFNAFGELVSQTDAMNHAVQMTYDTLSRIKTKASGGQTYTWTYDTAANGIGKPAQIIGPSGFQENYTYDSLGRPTDVSTNIDAVAYTVTTGYDTYSRVNRIDYPSAMGTRFSVSYQYTTNGYLEKVIDTSTGTEYWKADARNALGQVTQETLGNNLQTISSFDIFTGRLTNIVTGNGTNTQSLAFTYDSLGNLLSREDNLRNLTENFNYDTLNRLTAVAGPQAKSYTYNDLGNILDKSDVGSFIYGGSKPHAVTSAGGVTYTYDANGNMISDSSGRSITFDFFNRPIQVAKTGATASFIYDSADMLVKQTLVNASTTTTTLYIGELYEKVTTGSMTEHNHYILAEGEKVAIFTKRSDSTSNTYYMHKDHLGSTDVITDQAGGITDNLSYDPFGMRRNASTWLDQAGLTCQVTDYGYTGHLHLDDFGLIHMKSRIYDPKLGKFLSPDPVIQNVADMQMINRYSYCTNNPLKYIDPTGNELIELTNLEMSSFCGYWDFDNNFMCFNGNINPDPYGIEALRREGLLGDDNTGQDLSGLLQDYCAENNLFDIPHNEDLISSDIQDSITDPISVGNIETLTPNVNDQYYMYMYASNSNNPQDFMFYDDFIDNGSPILNINMMNNIASTAFAYISSPTWNRFVGYGESNAMWGQFKCNIFVRDVLSYNGIYVPNTIDNNFPPTASDWADQNNQAILSQGLVPIANPIPGAIGSDGTHVGIVSPLGNSTVSVAHGGPVQETNWGFRNGQNITWWGYIGK